MKRLLSIFILLTIAVSCFHCGSFTAFADETTVIENFETISPDYSLTAVNGTTVENGEWLVYDQGNGVGTAAKAAKDTLNRLGTGQKLCNFIPANVTKTAPSPI